MKRIYIILIIVMFGLFVACENDPYLYNDVDRIWLGGSVRTDSLFYSFRLYDLDVAEAVVNVAVHLTGLPASTDRYFTLEVVDSLTNVPAEAYQIGETCGQFPEVTLKSGWRKRIPIPLSGAIIW